MLTEKYKTLLSSIKRHRTAITVGFLAGLAGVGLSVALDPTIRPEEIIQLPEFRPIGSVPSTSIFCGGHELGRIILAEVHSSETRTAPTGATEIFFECKGFLGFFRFIRFLRFFCPLFCFLLNPPRSSRSLLRVRFPRLRTHGVSGKPYSELGRNGNAARMGEAIRRNDGRRFRGSPTL